MVVINGRVASLVQKPARIMIDAITSANTARARDVSAFKNNIGGNWIGPPEKSMIILGNPWASINKAIVTLVNNIPISICKGCWFTLIKCFMFIWVYLLNKFPISFDPYFITDHRSGKIGSKVKIGSLNGSRYLETGSHFFTHRVFCASFIFKIHNY